MTGLPRFTSTSSVLALLLACGPGTTDTDADTSAGSNTDTSAGSGSDSSATDTPTTDTTDTTDTPTTGTPTTDTPATDTGDPPNTCPDDALPPEGSACAPGSPDCNPFGHPCDPYTFATCLDGLWQHVDVGPGDPDECSDSCDPFPTEGAPCNIDGSSCNTGCANQCEFCNIMTCEGGTWQRVEVFPAPCLDCDALCDFTIVPMCAAGPPTKEACVAGCMEALVGRCEIAFADLRACAGPMPTFTCDDATRPLVEGCEDPFAAYYDCAGL